MTAYCMLTGLKAPTEKLASLRTKALEEQEAMKQKEMGNKIDFASFSAIGSVFANEPERKNVKVDSLTDIEEEEDISFL